MKNRRRWVWLLLLPVVVAGVAAFFIGYREYRQLPFDSLKKAMMAVSAAESSGAAKLAGTQYKEAVAHLDRGRRALDSVSRDWWPFGSFNEADSLLKEATRLAEKALEKTGNQRLSLAARTRTEVRRYEDSLTVWRKILDESLSRTDDEILYRSAAFKIENARELVDRGLYSEAARSIEVAGSVFTRLEQRRKEMVSTRQSNQDTWQSWVDQTIADSQKSGGVAIIVDKSAHRLYIFKAGKKIESYVCELGYNSGQQKRMAGDGATPEGKYRVVKVNNGSKFYRALLLNYPNDEDKKRFSENLKSGAIPAGAKIGGLIEIHGHGGTGKDWTDGCVAVTDKEMDKIMRLAGMGTPVTIVRHLKEPL
jgi:tetratricopeptide (TPR) repeat protein